MCRILTLVGVEGGVGVQPPHQLRVAVDVVDPRAHAVHLQSTVGLSQVLSNEVTICMTS